MKKILFALLSFNLVFGPVAMARGPQRAGKTSRKVHFATTTKNTPQNTTQTQAQTVENVVATQAPTSENITLTQAAEETQPTNNTQRTVAKQKVDEAVAKVQGSCSGIKSNLDTIFGLNVATTISSGTGTALAGGALASGLVKASKDEKIEENEEKIRELHTRQGTLSLGYVQCLSETKQRLEKLKEIINEIYDKLLTYKEYREKYYKLSTDRTAYYNSNRKANRRKRVFY